MLHSVLNCCRATSTTGPSREQPRCLGAALAVALHLLAAPGQHASAPESFGSDALPVPQGCRPSRVLLVTTGPATKVGPPTTNQPTCTFGVLQKMKQTAIHCLVYIRHCLY